MSKEETIRLKTRNLIYLPLTRKFRKRKLRYEDFTIISNNCWGGTIYESYGLEKKSPTVGMFIMPEDYLKLVTNIEYYLEQQIVFIETEDSKWESELKQKSNWGTYLIGKLDDIELHMLHYHDEELARKKWNKRVKRINRNYLIYKFNDQNGATIEHIKRFMELPLRNKLCFVSQKSMQVSHEVILISQPAKYKAGIMASREPIGKTRYINITEYINALGEEISE